MGARGRSPPRKFATFFEPQMQYLKFFGKLSSARESKKDPAKPAVGTISVKYPALENIALALDVYICKLICFSIMQAC